jgi:large subunit ribosomal protein L17
MHRHGYQGRKFHRKTDQRQALIKGLADSLIKYGSIETTLYKAKEIRPYVEKLITTAKKNDLQSRRQIISKLQTLSSAHKLVDQIAPQLSSRDSGYLRIVKTKNRLGDNTQMAKISFVDEIKLDRSQIETTEELVLDTTPVQEIKSLKAKDKKQDKKTTPKKEKKS